MEIYSIEREIKYAATQAIVALQISNTLNQVTHVRVIQLEMHKSRLSPAQHNDIRPNRGHVQYNSFTAQGQWNSL